MTLTTYAVVDMRAANLHKDPKHVMVLWCDNDIEKVRDLAEKYQGGKEDGYDYRVATITIEEKS